MKILFSLKGKLVKEGKLDFKSRLLRSFQAHTHSFQSKLAREKKKIGTALTEFLTFTKLCRRSKFDGFAIAKFKWSYN